MKGANDLALRNYAVTAVDRQHNIWQRDPLAIRILNKEMAAQKLDYLHLNPMQPYCLLCSNTADYRFLSARFYGQNLDEFEILTYFGEVF